MGITLEKGKTISLEKGGAGLTKVFMGLGWDAAAAPAKKKGLFGGLLGGGGGKPKDIDLDASVIMLDSAKKVLDTVYYGQPNSRDGSIRHGGDNLTGAGDGDDEVIYLDLTALPDAAAYLVFTVNSFSGQTFNEVENATARLVDDTNNTEICTYQLTEQGAHTGVIMASLAKTAGGWTMTAHGTVGKGRKVKDMAAQASAIV
jgi:tellurium resistance protein TerZ